MNHPKTHARSVFQSTFVTLLGIAILVALSACAGAPKREKLDMQVAALEVNLVDVGDFQLAARRRLEPGSDRESRR